MATIDINNKGRMYTEEQLQVIKDYQTIYNRLRILSAQMADMQEETNDLIETLDKMRLKENNNNNNG